MNVVKKELPKSQVELTVELSAEEFAPYVKRGAEAVSREVKIEGFRPGKAPYEMLKRKIGEMAIMEKAAHIAIRKTLDEVIEKNAGGSPVGSPKVEITKLAPENPFVYRVTLAMLPEIKLGDYRDLGIKQKKAEVADGEVDKLLSELREMRVKEAVVDREISEGDKALADISMFLDKVPVEGGQNKDTPVIIGKNYILPGFDKKLIGARKGEKREFILPYPDDHHMKNLAGKMVEFAVNVKEVYGRELPALDDNFASGFGLKKLDELKNNIKKSIEDQKKKETEQKAEREMLERIVAKSRFGDIPEMLVENEAGIMLSELEQAVAGQGGKFEDYLAGIGKTRDQLTLDLLPEAVKRVKTSLLIRELAKTEKIGVSGEEIERQVGEMRKHYQGMSKNDPEAGEMAARTHTPEFKNYVANTLTSRKVIDRLKEWNIEK